MLLDLTDADSAAFLATRDEFISRVSSWALDNGHVADERVLGQIADYTHAHDGRLDRWTLDKVDDLFAVHFTTLADLDVEFAAAATPTMITTLQWLDAHDTLDVGDDSLTDITAELETMAPQFEALMASPEEAAKTAALVRTMQHQGISLDDSEAVTKWMTKFSRKSPALQQRLINEALEATAAPPEPLDAESTAALAALRGPAWLDALGDLPHYQRADVIDVWVSSIGGARHAAADVVAGLREDPEQVEPALQCLRACGDDAVDVATDELSAARADGSDSSHLPALLWLVHGRADAPAADGATVALPIVLDTLQLAASDGGPAGLLCAFERLVEEPDTFASRLRTVSHPHATDLLEALGAAVSDKQRAKAFRKAAFQRRSAQL